VASIYGIWWQKSVMHAPAVQTGIYRFAPRPYRSNPQKHGIIRNGWQTVLGGLQWM
jgi:hypothetical protein